MSPSHLPNDVRRWPTNPYELLGVDWGCDFRQLRRAYAGLIRVYKPEQHPEQFRRIREAYDALKNYVRREEEPADEEDSPVQRDEPLPTELRKMRYDAMYGNTGLLDQDLQSLWELACDGQPAVSYRHQVRLLERFSRQEDLYLQLYWLLVIWPEADVDRDPCEWLVAGLKQTGLTGRLWDLYLEELEHRPDEAGGSRCDELLDSAAAPARLAQLVEKRWNAASRAVNIPLIAADREKLRQRFCEEDPSLWAGLLMSALSLLAWNRSPAASRLFEECLAEAEKWTEGSFALAEALGRIDLLAPLRQDWWKLGAQRTSPAWFVHALEELVPELWLQSADALRPQLLELLDPLVEKPSEGLALLDKLTGSSKAVLHHLGMAIESLYRQHRATPACGPTRFEQHASELAQEFEELCELHPEYCEMRLDLFRICTRESASADELVEFLVRRCPQSRMAAHIQEIVGDAPLHYLIQAFAVFWA
jgi:hypothetical protein